MARRRTLAAAAALTIGAGAALLSGAPAATPPKVDLTVLSSRGDGASQTVRLRCSASDTAVSRATGYLRSRGLRTSCRAARRLASFLARPADAQRVCTEVYGGPDTATVGGTIGTRRINRRFGRTDGCEIADWDRAQPLLPRPVGASAPAPAAP